MILSCWIGDLTGSHILSSSHTTNQVISETLKKMFIIFQCFSPIFHQDLHMRPSFCRTFCYFSKNWTLASSRKPLGVWSSSLGMASASWRGSSHLGLRYWSSPCWHGDLESSGSVCVTSVFSTEVRVETPQGILEAVRDSWIPIVDKFVIKSYVITTYIIFC